MHEFGQKEHLLRGTYEFPFEFHHVDDTHPRYVMSYHWHVEYEIIRILEGTLSVTLDEKSFLAQKGDVIFIHSGILHSGIPEHCVYECVVFDANTFLKNHSVCAPYIQKLLRQEILVFHHFTSKQEEILSCTACIFEAFAKKPEGFELTVIGQLYHFFGIVFARHYYLNAVTKNRRAYKRLIQLKQVLEYMEENYTAQVTLDELAASVNMSPKYFCRFFSEMTHQTPVDYLNRQRVEQACFQLSTTEDSVTEIAYRNGFNDLSYFIRIFRRYKGVTPGKYRGERI